MCNALSAEISVLQNIPLHANECPQLIENYNVYMAVSKDAKAIYAKRNYFKVVLEDEKPSLTFPLSETVCFGHVACKLTFWYLHCLLGDNGVMLKITQPISQIPSYKCILGAEHTKNKLTSGLLDKSVTPP